MHNSSSSSSASSSASSSGSDSDEHAGDRRKRKDEDAKAKSSRRTGSSKFCTFSHNTRNECTACIHAGEQTPAVVPSRKYKSKKGNKTTATPQYSWFIK